MAQSHKFENHLFNSLEIYLQRVLTKIQQDPKSLYSFINVSLEQDDYLASFLLDEQADDCFYELIVAPDNAAQGVLETLLDEGFFLLCKHKPNTTLGKLYQIFYCKNRVRIISKNLLRCGYLFVTKKTNVINHKEHLILLEATQENLLSKELPTIEDNKKLVEILPKLFVLTSSCKQALILNTNFTQL